MEAITESMKIGTLKFHIKAMKAFQKAGNIKNAKIAEKKIDSMVARIRKENPQIDMNLVLKDLL